MIYDAAIIGAGIAGMGVALRLQKKGLKTIVFESHNSIGGCAGFFKRKSFHFDVGATTLVDFNSDGIGGLFFKECEMSPPELAFIDGYSFWLPDKIIHLYRDKEKWNKERLEKLGDSESHKKFWNLLDKAAEIFWKATRTGITLPIRSMPDLLKNAKAFAFRDIFLFRYLNKTMLQVLGDFGLEQDKALCAFLNSLIEDTVHSNIHDAPFINSALGVTIRGAGLMRAKGGMFGFWKRIETEYKNSGGILCCKEAVIKTEGIFPAFKVQTKKRVVDAKVLVSALPIELTANIAIPIIKNKLKTYLERDSKDRGGAIVLFLGVPDREVANQSFTHHQLFQNYEVKNGNGNNMFISISDKGDTLSAPVGYRAVMISTHTELNEWQNLSEDDYQRKKNEIGRTLLNYARRVYPDLGNASVVFEIGTPRTYERFTSRPSGAVGGSKLTPKNSNFHSVPHDIGIKGFWLTGDTTWPGLGTVAGMLSSRNIADNIIHAL